MSSEICRPPPGDAVSCAVPTTSPCASLSVTLVPLGSACAPSHATAPAIMAAANGALMSTSGALKPPDVHSWPGLDGENVPQSADDECAVGDGRRRHDHF